MSENPARELLEIFNGWAEAGGSAVVSRAPMEPAGINKIIRAMALIHQIRRELDRLSADGVAVNVYEGASDEWARAVIAVQNEWNAQDPNGTVNIHNQGRIDMLEGLTLLFDGIPPAINQGAMGNLRGLLDGVMSLLGEDASIDDALRKYVATLIGEVHRALDDYELGYGFDAARSLEHLWIALRAAAGASKAHKKRWADYADTVFKPAAAGILAGLPTLAIEAIKLTTGH